MEHKSSVALHGPGVSAASALGGGGSGAGNAPSELQNLPPSAATARSPAAGRGAAKARPWGGSSSRQVYPGRVQLVEALWARLAPGTPSQSASGGRRQLRTRPTSRSSPEGSTDLPPFWTGVWEKTQPGAESSWYHEPAWAHLVPQRSR